MAQYIITIISRRRRARIHRVVRDGYYSLTGQRNWYGNRGIMAFAAGFLGSLVREIYRAFLQRSWGVPDETGYRWEPLSPSTIAGRPISEQERAQFGIDPAHRRGLLTPAQDKLWRRIFRGRVQYFIAMGMDEETEAKPRAAAAAWAILKSRGAMTRKELLSNRRVPILRVTGRLANSLDRGITTTGLSEGSIRYRPANRDQIYRVGSSSFEWGTCVPYAAKHHFGTTRKNGNRVPARRLWPPTRQMHRWIKAGVFEGTISFARRISRDMT